MLKKLKTLKSFTLLEIIISVSIFALVALGISLVFQRSLVVFRASTDKNQAAQQAQIATEWLARDIGSAYGIFIAEANNIALVNPDQQYIRYFLNPADNTIQRQDCSYQPYLLAENVTGFSLKYYDINNQQIAGNPIDKLLSLKTIEINISTQKNNQKFRLNSVAGFQYDPACSWAKAYGGAADESLNSLQQTSDGGYILGGYTSSFGVGGKDFLTIKTDSSGIVQWAKTYGGSSSLGDNLHSLQQTTPDGGYILGGDVASLGAGGVDLLLVKTDSNGNVGAAYPGTWAKTYGGTSGDYLHCLQQTSDGGYILGGQTFSFGAGGTDDFLVIKTDSLGRVAPDPLAQGITWVRAYGSSAGADNLHCLQQTSDGGYILGGETSSFGGAIEFLVIKIDNLGNIDWASTYGAANNEMLHSLQQTSDGGYILGGKTSSFGNETLVIKTDSLGRVTPDPLAQGITWKKTYGTPTADYLYSLQQTSDGGYILGAETSDFLLIKINDLGNLSWPKAKTYGGVSGEFLYSLQQTLDGGYIIGGETSSFGVGNKDFFLLKTGPLGELGCCNGISVGEASLTVGGNPALNINDVKPSLIIGNPAPTVKEYPDTSALADFTLQTKEYDGILPDDFTPTTTLVCPSP